MMDGNTKKEAVAADLREHDASGVNDLCWHPHRISAKVTMQALHVIVCLFACKICIVKDSTFETNALLCSYCENKDLQTKG